VQSEFDNQTSLVFNPSILPITGLAIGIRYPDLDIGPYRVAVFVRISRFSGYRASGYQGLTVLYFFPNFCYAFISTNNAYCSGNIDPES
jgi:hypothetical protein